MVLLLWAGIVLWPYFQFKVSIFNLGPRYNFFPKHIYIYILGAWLFGITIILFLLRRMEARSFNICLHILTKMIWLGIWIMQGSIGLTGMSKSTYRKKKKNKKRYSISNNKHAWIIFTFNDSIKDTIIL